MVRANTGHPMLKNSAGRVSHVGESGGIFTALQKHTSKNFDSNTQRISNGSLFDVFKGDTVQVFEVNGNQIQDKQDAIRYARTIATESGKSVMVWESETSLPVAHIKT